MKHVIPQTNSLLTKILQNYILRFTFTYMFDIMNVYLNKINDFIISYCILYLCMLSACVYSLSLVCINIQRISKSEMKSTEWLFLYLVIKLYICLSLSLSLSFYIYIYIYIYNLNLKYIRKYEILEGFDNKLYQCTCYRWSEEFYYGSFDHFTNTRDISIYIYMQKLRIVSRFNYLILLIIYM